MKSKRYVNTLKQFLRERVFFCQGFPYWGEPPYQPKVCPPPTFFPCIAKIPPSRFPPIKGQSPPLDNNFVCSHCSCTSTSHCSCTIVHMLWTQFMLILILINVPTTRQKNSSPAKFPVPPLPPHTTIWETPL